ncbi:MAG: flagellar biosynthesis protein FlhB [Hyphomicrobiaceae bacterium]|nr:flagellar biosynthesis protein FlhB [Hyphomicrobiaceae bacterium]
MSDEPDESEKTEEPSQKKLDDAKKKGNIPKSQEVTSWFMLLSATLFIMIFSGDMSLALAGLLSGFMGDMQDIPMDGASLLEFLRQLMMAVAAIVGMPFLFFWFAGVAGNIVQFPPILTTEPIKPKFSKISPLAGVKRMFSAIALVNFVKSLIKLVAISVIIAAILLPKRDLLDGTIQLDPAALPPLLRTLSLQVLGGVLALLTVIAGADYAFQRHTWHKKLRMTLKEVKDEYKMQEGDPHIKGKIAQIRREKSQQRMMQSVPDATVIVTNPTHFAVALKYEEGMPAPICVAKGQDNIALKIREIGKENDVAIVENKPLARALYASAEIDDEIPVEHFKAVAEVIGYVMRLRGKKK